MTEKTFHTSNRCLQGNPVYHGTLSSSPPVAHGRILSNGGPHGGWMKSESSGTLAERAHLEAEKIIDMAPKSFIFCF